MNLQSLQHFVTVAKTRNFTQAATVCGLSQSALSRSILRLEQDLGQPVFERQSRDIALTDAGTLLLPRAHNILALVADARAEIADDGQTGRVRVGAIPTIAPYFLPALLSVFSSQFPQARVVVQEETTDQLLHSLSEGNLDVAILARPVVARYLSVQDLFEEELLLALPTGHPLTKQAEISVAELEPLPFVLLGEAHCLTGNILSFCQQRSLHPVAVERTSQLATVQELVSLNHGVSLIPAMARRLDQSDKRVYRSLAGTPPTRVVAIAWNDYRFQSRLVTAFRELAARFSVATCDPGIPQP